MNRSFVFYGTHELFKALQSLNISIDSALEQRQVENK